VSPVRLHDRLRQIGRNGLTLFPQVDFDQARPQSYDKIDEVIPAASAGIGRNHLRYLIRPFNRRMGREPRFRQ
jgi:hypothetical protein